MSEQHIIQQLLAKNNIILDQYDATMIEDNNPYKEYNCCKYCKSQGFTLLHKLVLIANKYSKLCDIIKGYILLYPEEVNKVNEKGWSALLLAISKDVPKVVKLLLEHNADINIKTNDGWIALIYASSFASESSLKIIKLLVEYGANVNAYINVHYYNNGMTALIRALCNATESSPKIIKLLLEYDANVSRIPNDKHPKYESNIRLLNILS